MKQANEKGYGEYFDVIDKGSRVTIFNNSIKLRDISKMPLKNDSHAIYLAVEALNTYINLAEPLFKRGIEVGQKVALGRLGAFELADVFDCILCDGDSRLTPIREYVFDSIGAEWKIYKQSILGEDNLSPNDYFFMHYSKLSKYVSRLLLRKTNAYKINNPTIKDIFDEACKIQWRYESGVGNKTLNALIEFFEQFGLYLNR